jgi:hypothetical protein
LKKLSGHGFAAPSGPLVADPSVHDPVAVMRRTSPALTVRWVSTQWVAGTVICVVFVVSCAVLATAAADVAGGTTTTMSIADSANAARLDSGTRPHAFHHIPQPPRYLREV